MMTKSEFENAYRKLVSAHGSLSVNTGCIACEQCTGAVDSTFCVECTKVARCHYCRASEACSDCSHCTGCHDCLSCAHCQVSERCSQSAYLERCAGCSRCSYCFGCVGLSGKDFHILNEPYARDMYFENVKRLRRELGIKEP